MCCRHEDLENFQELVWTVMENVDVNQALRNMDCSTFSENPSRLHKLRKLLWRRRALFKGLGRIKGVPHRIELKPEARRVCESGRRRSPKEEEVEKTSMEKIVNTGVL